MCKNGNMVYWLGKYIDLIEAYLLNLRIKTIKLYTLIRTLFMQFMHWQEQYNYTKDVHNIGISINSDGTISIIQLIIN